MNILFLHGWTSVPGGLKPSFLVEAGHQVYNPAIPDNDFERSVAIGNHCLTRQPIDVIVGSSRGGAVAMNLAYESRPLILLCPAWKRWGSAQTISTRAIILHSRDDDVIPFGESETLMRGCDARLVQLIEVGSDHRLATPDALKAMREACEQLADSQAGP